MRKPKTHYATRGYLSASGATKIEARANLDKMIDWACGRASSTIETRFGLIIALSADSTGWNYSIVNPATVEHGKQIHSSCCLGQIDYSDALQFARSHAAQNAWNHDVADDSAFVDSAGLGNKASELASWIHWQRSYKQLRQAGKTDSEAHALAFAA